MVGLLRRFLSSLRNALVQDVPPAFDACESCRNCECDDAQRVHCQRRLDLEAQNLRARHWRQAGRSNVITGGGEAAHDFVPASQVPHSGVTQHLDVAGQASGLREVAPPPTKRSGAPAGGTG